MQSKISRTQLLGELEDLIRRAPQGKRMESDEDDIVAWRGAVRGVFSFLDVPRMVEMHSELNQLGNLLSNPSKVRELMLAVAYSLRLETVGTVSVAIGSGRVFDYFDVLAKLIEEARQDILFVDPYLDRDFVSTYLAHVKPGTATRLLTSMYLDQLIPAAELWAEQSGLPIEVRASAGLHDRFLFVDGRRCFQSGASFKDGGRKATTLTEIVDPFPAVQKTFEDMWTSAAVRFPKP